MREEEREEGSLCAVVEVVVVVRAQVRCAIVQVHRVLSKLQKCQADKINLIRRRGADAQMDCERGPRTCGLSAPGPPRWTNVIRVCRGSERAFNASRMSVPVRVNVGGKKKKKKSNVSVLIFREQRHKTYSTQRQRQIEMER